MNLFIKPILLAAFSLVVAPAWAQYSLIYSHTDNEVTFTKVLALPNKEVLLTGTSGNNVFFRKIDANNNPLWDTEVDGEAVRDIVVDPNGNIFVSSYDNDGTPVIETRALDKTTGVVKWTNSVNVLTNADASLAVAKVNNSLLLFSNTTVLGAGSDVLARRINPTTGVNYWSKQIDEAGMNDRSSKVTINASGAAFFAMTIQSQNPGGGPLQYPTVKRMEAGNGAIVWSRWFNSDAEARITDLFVMSDGYIGVSGSISNHHIDRILHPDTGALQSAAPTDGPPLPRSAFPSLTGELFSSFEGADDAQNTDYRNAVAVKFVSRNLWRTIYSDRKDLYTLTLLGVNRSNRPVILRTNKDGLESGIKRFTDRFYEPLIRIQKGTDFNMPGKFGQGIVDGHDIVVFNDHQVRRYSEQLQLNYDDFNLPFATQLTQGPGAIFLNDNGFGGGHLSLAAPPQKGTVQLNQDGSFTYTKGPNFTGQDSFLYRVVRDGVNRTAGVLINDLKITSVTFENQPVYGGESTKGSINFSQIPFPGEIQVVENSPLVTTGLGYAYIFPTTTSVPFNLYTQRVSVATNVPITARMHGTAKTGVVTLHPGAVSEVTFSKNPVVGGEILVGTVHLNGPALTARTIDLQPYGSTLITPGQVMIPVGATSATFEIRTAFASTDGNHEIRAQAQHPSGNEFGSSATGTLTVRARPRVVSFVGPASLSSGQTQNYTVSLDKVTPYNYAVTLTATSGATLPASVTVTPGNSGKTFSVQAATVVSPTTVTMTATTGGTTVTKIVQVNP